VASLLIATDGHRVHSHHDAVGVGAGQTAQNHGVNDSEYRRVGADPERQGAGGDQGEGGGFAQETGGVPANPRERLLSALVARDGTEIRRCQAPAAVSLDPPRRAYVG
jgi:hypothetical protein